ncbi:MAG TPA: ABC transporter permease [Puia sp.]|uniref:ABC transporter permease n=1 Tax=Puia sp. TaxID=2045100 RepID=UPI002BE0B6C8|nr:ABC transporter permease [Puia sp.]HVU98633.1 ABC transporter permease [Puia sp.]
MLKSYLTSAWRNLRRNKGYAFINIAGLSAGLAITLLIGLWITDELSFDHYHTHHARIAQILRRQVFPNHNNEIHIGPIVSTMAGPVLGKNYKDIISNTTLLSPQAGFLLGHGEKNLSTQGCWAQSTFPGLFTFQMLAGDGQSIKDPSTLLLAQSTAKALFGNEDPVGKTIQLNRSTAFTVGGVYADLPFNTAFHEIQVVLPWDNNQNAYLRDNKEWEDHSALCFVELAGTTTAAQATARIKDIPVTPAGHPKQQVLAYPLDKTHLYGEFKDGAPSGGRIQFVWLFGTIGAFVLLLACINFMNLSTARSEQRAKEVGIRKTIGSRRYQLIGQFLGESILTAMLAFVGAIAIAALSLPFFNTLAAKQMAFPWTHPTFWLCALGFTGLTGLIAGSYPAFYLSAFQPVKVLKGTKKAGREAALPRKILVVAQFTISLSLTIATIVVFKQIEFAKDRPLGYNNDGLITVNINTPELAAHYDALRADLLNSGVVANVARSSQPTTLFNNGNDLTWAGQTEEQKQLNYHNVNVTPEFGPTIGWTVIQGRDFSRAFATDSNAAILNDQAVKKARLKDPIGLQVRLFGKAYTVIGVVKNMLTNSPFDPIEPAVFLGDGSTNFITMRLHPGASTRTALATIEPLFRKFNPGSPFSYTFNDEDYARKFAAETRIGSLATVFAGLAILISCLGLFGLASFVAEQRTKELGVRKILGAGVGNLWALLSGDFIKLVALSMCIAMPLAWYTMNKWLQNYTLHTNLSGWIFVAAGAGMLILTLATVSFQSLKAAFANPIHSLKTE